MFGALAKPFERINSKKRNNKCFLPDSLIDKNGLTLSQ